MHDRWKLAAPTRRSSEGCFPLQLAGSRVQATHHRTFDSGLRHQQFAVNVERRGKRQIDVRRVAPPQQPAGVLLDGDDQAFGRVHVEPPAAANRQVFDRSFQPPGPPHSQRRLQSLVVSVGATEVAVIRVPVELFPSQPPGQRTADLPHLQVLCGQTSISTRTENVEIAVLTTNIDFAVRYRDRSGDGSTERGRK